MKITDIINNGGKRLSFEVFPPKTDDKFEGVLSAASAIAALSPSFMSVPYGAGGGTSKYTLDIAKNIKELYGVPTLAHLTCVSSTKQTVMAKIEEMKEGQGKTVEVSRGFGRGGSSSGGNRNTGLPF